MRIMQAEKERRRQRHLIGILMLKPRKGQRLRPAAAHAMSTARLTFVPSVTHHSSLHKHAESMPASAITPTGRRTGTGRYGHPGTGTSNRRHNPRLCDRGKSHFSWRLNAQPPNMSGRIKPTPSSRAHRPGRFSTPRKPMA